MLLFMGLQRVGHDWATEMNWTEHENYVKSFLSMILAIYNLSSIPVVSFSPQHSIFLIFLGQQCMVVWHCIFNMAFPWLLLRLCTSVCVRTCVCVCVGMQVASLEECPIVPSIFLLDCLSFHFVEFLLYSRYLLFVNYMYYKFVHPFCNFSFSFI